MSEPKYQIITFYEFEKFENLPEIKQSLVDAMRENSILGTIILAGEGFNSTICGFPHNIEKFITAAEAILDTNLNFKSSFHAECPFHKIKVKIKPEIVSLRQKVEIEKGDGTHTAAAQWNEIINDAQTIVLDTRNDYEFQVGTFRGAINPQIEKFSDLPKFVEENFNPQTHKRIAMFCTGGIRCEKFAPYMKDLGFEEIYQLEGGILRYLEQTPENESLWEGECFVFDDRITVDENLQKGNERDLSVKTKSS
jgi:UPF0176 protein